MEKVFDATQIQRLVGNKEERKPQCLILDEIDGAQDGEGRSAIKALCDYIQGKGIRGRRKKKDEFKENEKEENESGNESEEDFVKEVEKDKNKKTVIKRPIICICNDLYAKSIVPLRKLAVHFILRGADTTKIASVLQNICNKERVMVSFDLLGLLSKQSKYDIRNCLNTLQFTAKKTKGNHRLITKDMLFYKDSNNLISSKDCFQGIFEVWDELLRINIEKGKMTVRRVKEIIQKNDNASFILDGIYCNALNNEGEDLKSIGMFMVLCTCIVGLFRTL